MSSMSSSDQEKRPNESQEGDTVSTLRTKKGYFDLTQTLIMDDLIEISGGEVRTPEQREAIQRWFGSKEREQEVLRKQPFPPREMLTEITIPARVVMLTHDECTLSVDPQDPELHESIRAFLEGTFPALLQGLPFSIPPKASSPVCPDWWPTPDSEFYPTSRYHHFCAECGDPISAWLPRRVLDEEVNVSCACGASYTLRAREIKEEVDGSLSYRLEWSHRTLRSFGKATVQEESK